MPNVKHDDIALVIYGDTPLLSVTTLGRMVAAVPDGGLAVLTANFSGPTGFGGIVRDSAGAFDRIVEQKDADEETLKINEVNSGGFWFDCELLLSVLDRIKSDNKAKEYYLPDAIKLLLSDGRKVGAYTAECSDTVLGANDPSQLEELNEIAKARGYSC